MEVYFARIKCRFLLFGKVVLYFNDIISIWKDLRPRRSHIKVRVR